MHAKQIAAYSVGHFNNDLCASMWFIYLSWYISTVVGASDTITASAMLSGQIADGVTTPLVGFFSDKCNTKIGKRTPFYIFGTIFVIPCFLGIFSYPEFVNKKDADGNIENLTLQSVWYCTLPALFNIGWASVQISNMSIVNQLSRSNRKRDLLVNNRNGFTSAASVFVLSLCSILFSTVPDAIH